jgi:hypothetical protein
LADKKNKPVNDLAISIEARGHRQTLLLWPQLWKKHNLRIKLRWKGKPFSAGSKTSIPNKPGVYAFVIQPGVPTGVPVSVLMYIGMCDRPLRERFGEYLREMNDPSGRPAITTMLRMYNGYLHFYCACVAKPTKPASIEAHLIETLAPPMNKQYPAKISRIIGAFS